MGETRERDGRERERWERDGRERERDWLGEMKYGGWGKMLTQKDTDRMYGWEMLTSYNSVCNLGESGTFILFLCYYSLSE